MIAEAEVLFRVQHFQKRRRWITPEISPHLVHLIQHEHRIVGTGPSQALDDAAGHGSHIGAAVAPDLGLVAHPAQGDAAELAAHAAGDGAAQAGFAHPGRTHEAQDGPLHLRVQLAHGQIFQDAALHLI